MFYWYHPTSMQPLTPPSPLTSVWQNKIRSSRKWYQVRFEFLLKSFEDTPRPSHLIWVQTGSTRSSLPQSDPGVQSWYICQAGLHLTQQDQSLIYRSASVCVCVCVHKYKCLSTRVCICVYYVFAHSLGGEFVLSAPLSIHQAWHFLPFHIQSKHSAARAISTLRDVERAHIRDLTGRNYAIVTLTHWFGMLPFLNSFSWDR